MIRTPCEVLTVVATAVNLCGEHEWDKQLLAEAADLTGPISQPLAPAAMAGTLLNALPKPVAILQPEALGPRNIATTGNWRFCPNYSIACCTRTPTAT